MGLYGNLALIFPNFSLTLTIFSPNHFLTCSNPERWGGEFFSGGWGWGDHNGYTSNPAIYMLNTFIHNTRVTQQRDSVHYLNAH